MALLRDLSIYWSMVHVIFLFLLLFRSRYTRKKTVWIAGVSMGVLMLLNSAILLFWGFEALTKLFLLTCSLPTFVLFYVLSANKTFRFCLSFCLVDTTCMWFMAVTALLDQYLGGGRGVLLFISRLAAFPLAEYFVWRYLRKPYLALQESVEKGWGICACMTMLYYILLAVAVQFPTNILTRPEDTLLCVLILLLMPLTYATIFLSLHRQLLLYRKQRSEQLLQQQKSMLEAQLLNQQRIRKMKHDMKGHTVTLSGLLAAGKVREAQEYLAGVEAEMAAAPGQLCANPYLNAVLGQYSARLEAMGAGCTMEIGVSDEPLPYMELCQILSNGLENACEALEHVEAGERSVLVRMKYSRKYLVLRIRNRCGDALTVEKGAIPPTSKTGLDHGFGLPTIQQAAQKLGGEMLCYTQNGYFFLDVILSRGMFAESGGE